MRHNYGSENVDKIVADLNARDDYGPSFELTAEQYGNLLRERIQSEFRTERLHEYLMEIEASKHRRVLRAHEPTVHTLDHDAREALGSLVLPGSITIFWAERGSDFVDELESVLRDLDERRTAKLRERIRREYSQRSILAIDDAVDTLLAQDSFLDVGYGGKTIGPNLTLTDDVRFGSLTLPYNGGKLEEEFTVTEYVEYEESEGEFPYEVVIAVHSPRLSEIERKALSAVPRDVSELNIGTSAVCGAITLAVVLLVTTTCTMCDPLEDELARVSLPDRTVQELGPVASARELVNARRELLGKYGV